MKPSALPPRSTKMPFAVDALHDADTSVPTRLLYWSTTWARSASRTSARSLLGGLRGDAAEGDDSSGCST